MYTHAQASRPASTSSTIFLDSQYQYSSEIGTAFAYDVATGYPSLPIPSTSSSSLAAALVPAPELTQNGTSGSSSQLVERSDEQLNGRESITQCAVSSADEATTQTDMSDRFSKSYDQHFVNPGGPFRTQQQMYQGTAAPDPPLNQPQSSNHYPCAQTQASPPSSSTYIPPQQSASYMPSNESQWTPDVSFPGYSENFSFSSLASNVADPSQFSAFPQDYTFSSADINDGNIDVYGTGGSVEGWSYTQGNLSFEGSDGAYLSFNDDPGPSTCAEPGAWLGPFARDGRFQDGQSPPFVTSSSLPITTSEAVIIPRQCSTGPSEAAVENNYFTESQNARQQLEGDNLEGIQRQYQNQVRDEGLQQSEPSPLETTSHSVPPAPSAAQAVHSDQGNGRRRQYRGHNELMPPPPLPPRAHTLNSEYPQPENRFSQTTPTRRHTVAAPVVRNGVTERQTASPASSQASINVRRSSTAPEPSPSPGLRNVPTKESSATPRLATKALNDDLWKLTQEGNRSALAESFRIVHGGHDPPPEMHIHGTSALERSRKDEHVLLGSSSEQKTGQANHRREAGVDSSAQSSHRSEGADGPGESSAPARSEPMSDEEFFSRSQDWVPARPGYELEQDGQSLGTHDNANPLISPISPATTDSLVTPSDASTSSAMRRPQISYAYATPANPDRIPTPQPSALIQNVLPVMRHDGHLPQHISGLGGTFQNAYDGQSYLTDDSEDDPEHLPIAPSGARSGDHRALASLLPNPLKKRGQVWHDLTKPMPTKDSLGKQKGMDDMAITGHPEEQTDADEEENLKKLEKEGVKTEEQGEGWGYVEAGSHGPQFALPGAEKGGSHGKRLKLSTEKKTPPKMACHFCRNRKIACGASKCGDPTICNQCERRNIRCIFPTISRRGMRTRNPRSAHTVDGTDEADKDSLECNDSPDTQGTSQTLEEEPSNVGIPKRSVRTKRQVEKGSKDKEPTKGRSRGKGKRKAEPSENNQEGSSKRVNGDVGINRDEQSLSSGVQVSQTPSYADDPLASLAAEMQSATSKDQSALPTQFESGSTATLPAPSSFSSSSLSGALQFAPSSFEVSFTASNTNDAYSLHADPSPGLFTSTPLQRRL